MNLRCHECRVLQAAHYLSTTPREKEHKNKSPCTGISLDWLMGVSGTGGLSALSSGLRQLGTRRHESMLQISLVNCPLLTSATRDSQGGCTNHARYQSQARSGSPDPPQQIAGRFPASKIRQAELPAEPLNFETVHCGSRSSMESREAVMVLYLLGVA